MVKTLEKAGLQAKSAEDGQDALKLYDTHGPPDVFLMDIHMPRLNGLETTLLLRSPPRSYAGPIVALTGNSAPSDVAAALSAGINRVLIKPVKGQELVRMVVESVLHDAG